MKSKGTYTLRRLFPSLREEEIAKIQEHSSVIRLRKGQNLFISGDSPRSIYAVANGCLKIVREGTEGESVITRIVRPGQIVGIREVFGEFKYLRTSVALKDSEVFSIDARATLDLIVRSPSVSMQFMKIFCTELARLEKRIESDLYRPAKSRVASVILELHSLFADEGSNHFEPPLNRRELAELADVTPETVSRAIADFKSNGMLETQGSSFNIIEMEDLRSEADDR